MTKKTPPPEELDYKQVHETPIDQLVGEPSKAETPEPSKEEPVKEVEIEWDPQEFEAKMTEKMGKISEESAQKVVEQVTKKKESENEKEEELISPWKKEGRLPKDYEEVSDWAVEKKQILDQRSAKVAEREKSSLEEKQKSANSLEVKRFNDFVDSQVAELVEDGKLPGVENALNPADPGLVARKQLFQTMMDVNVERQKKGKPPVYSIKEVYYEHFDKKADEEPAGADAPVSPGKSAPQGEPKEVDYREVHKKSLIDIVMGK